VCVQGIEPQHSTQHSATHLAVLAGPAEREQTEGVVIGDEALQALQQREVRSALLRAAAQEPWHDDRPDMRSAGLSWNGGRSLSGTTRRPFVASPVTGAAAAAKSEPRWLHGKRE
jgi:hypothetical protein